ncbi:MAG TPA: cytochrome c oxidase assembly protein [Acidimicrobiales bacterium]|nr:cytochrome c oxidase assembly protein [Acidimicrobiales bacterium]
MIDLAATVVRDDPWRWQPHPEVWALIAGLSVAYWWAVTRIGPRATRPDEVVVTRGQVAWFVAALLTLWVAADWPVHDLGEQYLYGIHMGQHLLLTLVVPPMALLATPTWLARMLVGQGRGYGIVRRLARPVVATLIFNAVVVFTHWPAVVNTSVSNGVLHYGVHVVVVATALLMWMPVAGPLPELRLSLPMQMGYLFLQSIIPTVPAGWLTFADGIVYRAYDVVPRVFGMSIAHDQQMAGMLMKVGGGLFLWTVITMLFFRFATSKELDDRSRGVPLDRRAPVRTADGDVLTWEQVERELRRAGPAPAEPDR